MSLIIDVSHWQELIDWPKVQAAGVTHAAIKFTHGRHGGDPYAARNWIGAGKLGIKRGVFGWLVPSAEEEKLQARNLWQLADALGYDPRVDWFAAGDIEEQKGLTAASAYAYESEIEDRFGAPAWLYSNPNILTHVLGRPSWASRFKLWLAAYRSSSEPIVSSPAGWPAWSLWQYSKTGSLPGIVGKIDLNRLPAELPAVLYSARVNASPALNIRSGPGVEFSIVGRLVTGEVVDVIDESHARGTLGSGLWLSIGAGRWIAASYASRIA